MKINIGPYHSYFGPYQLAEFLCSWAKKEKDEIGFARTPTWVHEFGEWLAHGSIERNTKFSLSDNRPTTWLYDLLSWVDSKKHRKVAVRIDKYDTWSADATLALIILPMLVQLKATKHGAPFVEDADVPEGLGLRSTEAEPKANEWDTDSNHFVRWDWVLDQMIWSFEQLQPDCDWERQYHAGEHDVQWAPVEGKDLMRMTLGPKDTHVFDSEGHRKHAARIAAGLKLFGIYFQNLWD